MPSKRLITEADVRALPRGSELVLGPDAIATPSALDAAFELRLRVVSAPSSAAPSGTAKGACGGSCSGCSSGSGPCTWSKMLAQDATYVVVVSGGKASVARMTPRGPEPFA